MDGWMDGWTDGWIAPLGISSGKLFFSHVGLLNTWGELQAFKLCVLDTPTQSACNSHLVSYNWRSLSDENWNVFKKLKHIQLPMTQRLEQFLN